LKERLPLKGGKNRSLFLMGETGKASRGKLSFFFRKEPGKTTASTHRKEGAKTLLTPRKGKGGTIEGGR